MSAAASTVASMTEKYDPKAYVLRPSSIEKEYYCGDLQGTLQLRKDPHELVGLKTSHLPDDDKNWNVVDNNDELFLRLLRKIIGP